MTRIPEHGDIEFLRRTAEQIRALVETADSVIEDWNRARGLALPGPGAATTSTITGALLAAATAIEAAYEDSPRCETCGHARDRADHYPECGGYGEECAECCDLCARLGARDDEADRRADEMREERYHGTD